MSALQFSIATPVGSYHPLLPSCLESLRRQKQAVRVSLLDASGDPRVSDLAERFRDIIVYRRHGPDGGQAAAIREGWERTSGEILGWLNADDLLYPEALSAVAAVFQASPAVDVVYGHSAICDDALRMTGYHWAVSPPGPGLRQGCNISQPSCFFRRRACDEAGGLDGDLHYTMDWDLWLRLEAIGARFAFVGEPLSAVFWGEGTKTSGFNAARRRELSRLIDRYAPEALRTKVFRGFAVQAALDQLRPPTLRRLARETLFPNKQRVFGIGPDGRLDGQATIKWFHLASSPRSSLRVVITGGRDINVRASRPIVECQASDSEMVVRFAAAVPAGEIVTVEFDSQPGRVKRFRSCEWLA